MANQLIEVACAKYRPKLTNKSADKNQQYGAHSMAIPGGLEPPTC
jgi:hypothetical protein